MCQTSEFKLKHVLEQRPSKNLRKKAIEQILDFIYHFHNNENSNMNDQSAILNWILIKFK